MSEDSTLVVESDETAGPDETAEPDDGVDTGHLDDVEAGAGCTEIWEHLSEQREEASSD